MDEKEFLRVLSNKVEEQRRVTKTEILPGWAQGLGEWLAVNPWRVLVPMAVLVYGVWRMAFGVRAREIILAIFGGF